MKNATEHDKGLSKKGKHMGKRNEFDLNLRQMILGKWWSTGKRTKDQALDLSKTLQIFVIW